MKKIKISELPLVSSLRGLFTIGTDSNNRSVKVSLEFVEDETNKAVQNAEVATEAASEATVKTKAATEAANTATAAANAATAAANQATEAAQEATENAVEATTAAQEATTASNTATAAARTATVNADLATAEARTATTEAQKETVKTKAATEEVLATLGILVPTGLSVECLPRITFGNVNPIYIKATLAPETAMPNVIFLSDNKAIMVSPKGLMTVLEKGRSVIHVIPTCNTALAKTVSVVVGDPTLRLVTRQKLRFTQSGALRLN